MIAGARTITIRRDATARPVPARVIGVSAASDLAVVRIRSGAHKLRPARFANSDDVKIGAFVLAMGDPLGLTDSVTQGIVSSADRRVREQHSGATLTVIQQAPPSGAWRITSSRMAEGDRSAQGTRREKGEGIAMQGKIALEEHFNLPEFSVPAYVNPDNPQVMREICRRLLDVNATRLGEMDAAGIDYSLLSLNAPGVQAETVPSRAIVSAKQVNDTLAQIVAANPTRYGGLATLPMQDPAAAAGELERCATQLGFPGVMLNGYTNIGDANTGWYYDHERFWPVWERAEALGVPVYLHPRDPLPGNEGIYEGHPELFGAVWTFTVETATHALRLMTSGLFDRFPCLTLIIGHLGETLPFSIWRINHRISYMGDLIKFKRPLTHYLLHNFYVTTSGNFHTQTLDATLAEMGADRVLFSTDYPYESMREAADWFDNAAINDNDRIKIGRSNSEKLFRLKQLAAA